MPIISDIQHLNICRMLEWHQDQGRSRQNKFVYVLVLTFILSDLVNELYLIFQVVVVSLSQFSADLVNEIFFFISGSDRGSVPTPS